MFIGDDSMEFVAFWASLAAVLISFIAAVTFYNTNLSSKNDPQLACIEARGDWQRFPMGCKFPEHKGNE